MHSCVKDILREMTHDWCTIKNQEERNVMISHVQFSHTFFIFSNTVYNFSACMFLIVALWSYVIESAENRQFPIQATFHFPSKVFPFYELLCFIQFLILISVGFALIDSFFVTSVRIISILLSHRKKKQSIIIFTPISQ